MLAVLDVVPKLGSVKGPDQQGWFTAKCPFHTDNTPSLRVKADNGVFICMSTGCGIKGNLAKLARKLGIDIPQTTLSDADAITKLRLERLLDLDTLGHFQVRADSVRQAWAYPVFEGTRYKSYHSQPPHTNCDCPDCKKYKKYWHSRKTPNQLYGADDIPQGTSEIWLVNGEPAVWACFQAGLPAVCGLFGEGRLPDGAGALLKKLGAKKVNIVYDLDEAGYRAAAKATEALQDDLEVNIRELPGELGLHGDVGDLFVWYHGDAAAFSTAMHGLVILQTAVHGVLSSGATKVAGFYLEDGTVGEMVINQNTGQPSFFIRLGLTGQIVHQAEYEPQPGIKFLPSDSKLSGKVVHFADHPEDYGNITSLVTEVKAILQQYLYIADAATYDLAAVYVIFTWVSDKSDAVPYLRALGRPVSGKSTFLSVVGSLCYRFALTAGVSSVPSIFRCLDEFNPTLSIDEMDLIDKDRRAAMFEILNMGYVPGLDVWRVEDTPDGKRKVVFFKVFCPKIIASKFNFPDEALETRCLTILMSQKPKHIHLGRFPPPNRPPVEVLALRNKLLDFRLRHLAEFHQALPQMPQFEDARISPRLSQVLAPLKWLVRGDPTLLDGLTQFGLNYQAQATAKEKDSLYAIIVSTITDLYGQDPSTPIQLKTAAEWVNQALGSSEDTVTPRKLSDILRNKLHIAESISRHGKDNHSTVTLNLTQLRAEAERIGLTWPGDTGTQNIPAQDQILLSRGSGTAPLDLDADTKDVGELGDLDF